MVVLPHSSVAVKITVTLPVAPHSSLNEEKSLLHVTFPQASLAEASPFEPSQIENSDKLPKPSHSTVSFLAGSLIDGARLSSMVNVAEVVVVFPQASVAVKITVALPVFPHSSLNSVKSFVHVTFPQASLASAPPLSASQAFNSESLFGPHSFVASEAATSSVGAVLSVSENVAEVVAVRPQASVAVKVTVALPVFPQPVNPVKSLLHATPPHKSLAVAPPLSASQASSAPVVPSHSAESSDAGVSIVGGVVSSMVNVAEDVEVLPQSSATVNITVAVPVAPQPLLNEVKLLLQETLPQSSLASAPPFKASHAFSVSRFPAPAHSIITLIADAKMEGSFVSSTVKMPVEVAVFPQSSVAVKIAFTTEVAPQANVCVVS